MVPRQLFVVGADGSSGSTEALHWAMRQARATAAEVAVVAVWEVPTTLGYALSDEAGSHEMPSAGHLLIMTSDVMKRFPRP